MTTSLLIKIFSRLKHYVITSYSIHYTKLYEPVDRNLYEVLEQETQGIGTLPESLEKAIEYAKSSSFIKENLNDRILNSFITEKESECINYQKAIDKNNFEFVEYFLNY